MCPRALQSAHVRFGTRGPRTRTFATCAPYLCKQATLFGGNDGPSQSLVYYFALPPGFNPATFENQTALGLLRRFVTNGREADGSPTRDRWAGRLLGWGISGRARGRGHVGGDDCKELSAG